MVASPKTIEAVIGDFQRAAQANQATSTRSGNQIILTSQSGDQVMVTADLHGNRLNFNKLLRLADMDHNGARHLVMQEVCHGGPLYPSGNGCMSHLLLEDVARLKNRYPQRFHFLLSNHELAELTDFPIAKSQRMLNLQFRAGLQEMYGNAADAVRAAALTFVRSCPLAVRLPNGIFISHSVPADVEQLGFDPEIFQRPIRPDDLAEGGPVFRLVWGRDYRPRNVSAFARLVDAKILIHGHEPCAEGFHAPNTTQIILDCCGWRACYLILPLCEKLTHQQLVQRIAQVG